MKERELENQIIENHEELTLTTVKKLNKELETAIINENGKEFVRLVTELKENLNPNLLFTAIGSNNPLFIKFVALKIAINNNGSLAEAFKNLPNPIDVAINNYMQYAYNPQFEQFKELLLDNLIKTLEIFKGHDCEVSANNLYAVANIDSKVVDLLLEYKNIDLDSVNITGSMHVPQIFKKLVEKGGNIIPSEFIFSAILNNKIKIVELLLEMNVDLNTTTDLIFGKATPLLASIFLGQEEITAKLISHGVPLLEINTIDKSIHSNPNILAFFVKYDKSMQEFINSISYKNAYELFKKAKEENNILHETYLVKNHLKDVLLEDIYEIFVKAQEENDNKILSLIVKDRTSDIFEMIKQKKTQKENVKYFTKNAIPFNFKHHLKELYAEKTKNENGKWSVNFKFKENDFIIGSQHNSRDEVTDIANNTRDIQKNSKTYVKNEKLHYFINNEEIKSVEKVVENTPIYPMFVLSKNGKLHIQNDFHTASNHSHFIKGIPAKILYGYGKPIACGGHMNIVNGKITYVDNASGHYQPSLNQLKLAVKYLYQQGVVAENIKIHDHIQDVDYNLDTILFEHIEINAPELFGVLSDL